MVQKANDMTVNGAVTRNERLRDRRQTKITELSKIVRDIETIPVVAVFVLQNEYDNEWKCITNSEEIREWIEFAKECSGCEVKLRYEPMDDAFVMEIHTCPVSREALYETAEEEVRRELLCESNRIGKRYVDGEGWTWYG
ncbi:MAG: hypothetical protein ACXQTM_08355 [Methanosarcinales archaeon]